ncbi:MAG TPA: GFA family protein [Gemmatimonadota bacterium]
MTLPITGGCACGAIRYESTAEPLGMFRCHCRDCQRATGGPCSWVAIFAAEAFRFTGGTPRFHSSERASGGLHARGFCAECGSPLTGGQGDPPTPYVGVHVASLDDSTWFRPQMDIFRSRAQPWDRPDPALPQWDAYAPGGKERPAERA